MMEKGNLCFFLYLSSELWFAQLIKMPSYVLNYIQIKYSG
jgi:hypothetical protein